MSPTGHAPTSPDRLPKLVLQVVLGVAVVVSVIHYADNTLRFDQYAINPDSPVTEPLVVPAAWLVFTAIGVAGYVMYLQRRWWQAVACLAVYSVSGLVSLVHYSDGPPSAFDSVQNVLIVSDVVAGIAVVAFAFWLMFRRALHSVEAS
jgi:hypothetical protein